MNQGSQKADYGQDAPGVVRNLFLVAIGGFAVWGSAKLGLWSGELKLGGVNFNLAITAIWMAPWFLITGCWMVWDSKIGKTQTRERLLDRVVWRGDERVLDVGCGRGLMLIGAAKRLTSGKATGIDIWQTTDLSGNRSDATVENLRLEGVSDRAEVLTADMREIPFPDDTFDVIVSRAAIHNLPSSDDRRKAIAQLARVLKPGGHALIDDIRHGGEYASAFAEGGCEVREIGSKAVAVLSVVLTMGSIRPSVLVATKR